jgi:hypothetical protein
MRTLAVSRGVWAADDLPLRGLIDEAVPAWSCIGSTLDSPSVEWMAVHPQCHPLTRERALTAPHPVEVAGMARRLTRQVREIDERLIGQLGGVPATDNLLAESPDWRGLPWASTTTIYAVARKEAQGSLPPADAGY